MNDPATGEPTAMPVGGIAALAGSVEVDKVRGMLLGGALGDALGGPVEFLTSTPSARNTAPTAHHQPLTGLGGLAEIPTTPR